MLHIPRKPIYVSDSVSFTGRGKKLVEAFQVYKRYLSEACEYYKVDVHAYLIMESQVHILMTQHYDHSIPLLMRSLAKRYREYVAENEQYSVIWKKHDCRMMPVGDEKVLNWYRHIEGIQVKEGLIRNAIESRWSSHRYNAYGMRDGLITPHWKYLGLADNLYLRLKRYREMMHKDHERWNRKMIVSEND